MSDQSIKLGLALGLTTMGRWRGEQEQWEVLFEGTVETTFNVAWGNSTNIDSVVISDYPLHDYRLTVDGAVWTGVPIEDTISMGDCYIIGDTENSYLLTYKDTEAWSKPTHLVTQSAGTHAVKIERKVAKKYSFNGVVLPKLPEWDKSVYPYAVIARAKGYVIVTEIDLAMLVCSKSPITVDEDGTGVIIDNSPSQLTSTINYLTGETEWSEIEEETLTDNSNYYVSTYKATWANHDVFYEGSEETYLSTSAPIPIYE